LQLHALFITVEDLLLMLLLSVSLQLVAVALSPSW